MTLQTLLTGLQGAVGDVTGVKFAPDYPPDSAGDFPFAVTYLERFRVEQNTPQDVRALHTVRVELHVARKDLPEDVYTLLPFFETVTAAIINYLLTNTYAHAGITGTFGELGWDDTKTIGFLWTIQDVKIVTALS